MHTFYITGGTAKKRSEYIANVCTELHVSTYDIHHLIPKVEALSISITDIGPWQKNLFLTPLSSPFTIGVIPNAELLTTEAQHALLKTLEEPPPHAKIYIESQSSSSLLPTILSRCQIIQLTTHTTASLDVSILQLFDDSLSIGKKMVMLDEHISNKEEAKVWVTQAIHTLHTNRTTIPSTTYRHLMQRLLVASQQLAANVSYKLAIDQIIYPKIH
ncbi:MAG: hypothetical protein UU25_C0001G0006 [Microgenomates group bacterium GW2011_GWB1_40_9]|nr:MAG: hypothetical protein UT26_C0023G0004 [Microgenomates group bacterium GW2011_GWC1_39_12]KKR80095.1 MAG: hypothetical protein UU25_C0001G0006 [Microgenomates group bacterium GW2011_GWB1_40_9]